MSFSVTARLCTSSRASGTGSPRGTPVAVTCSAPRRSAVMGRSVDPVISQLTQTISSSRAGVPISSAWATVVSVSRTALKETAAMTVSPRSPGTATTRRNSGSP